MGETNHAEETLVERIVQSYEAHPESTRFAETPILNRELLIDILARLREVLFPGFFDKGRVRKEYVRYLVGQKIEYIQYNLTKQVAIALGTQDLCADCPRSVLQKQAEKLVMDFLEEIPALRDTLATDVQAAYDGDPAAYSIDEIILSYPGLMAVTTYRIAHELWVRNIPLIPRVLTEYAHNLTGIDIHPGATIGKYFFIDHGTGIVIGETTVIGERAKVYQGVTLGGLSTRKGQELKGSKRHPTLGDHVTIYSGTSVLGGETVLGDHVTVGGNTFVIHSIPSNTRVSAKPSELELSVGAAEDFSDSVEDQTEREAE